MDGPSKTQNIRFHSPPLQSKALSKEQFFATKKSNKRMKTSTCFSDFHQPSLYPQEGTLDFSLNSLQDRHCFKLEAKQLDSTFGEEVQFAFKRQQPKRKVNVRNATSQNTSGNLAPSKSPTTKSLLFRRNSPMVRNRVLSRDSSNVLPMREPIKQWELKDFILLGRMGQGSYSEVFRAMEMTTGWIFALKVLSKEQIKELQQENNVVRQIKINLFCQHPNIAKLYGFFCDQEHIYLVCEYACHQNLFEALYEPRLKLRKGLMSGVVASYAHELCSAVSYLHQNHLMHRDIKPQNILLSYGTIKLCDFGWAIHNPTKQLRSTLCGTPLYLAPELISQQDYSQAVDIWAIGVITYQMLTEDIPFTISKPSELYKIVSDEIKLERIRNREAADFIAKALQKDPRKRIAIGQLCLHPFLKG